MAQPLIIKKFRAVAALAPQTGLKKHVHFENHDRRGSIRSRSMGAEAIRGPLKKAKEISKWPLFEDGERVIIEWSFGGTFRNEFAGHSPTGGSSTLRRANSSTLRATRSVLSAVTGQ